MTKKIGKDEFKKLLEGALSERTSIQFSRDNVPPDEVEQKLKLPDDFFKPRDGQITKARTLFGMDGDKDKLDFDDLAIAHSKPDGTAAKDIANKIANTQGVEPDVKNDWDYLNRQKSTDPTQMGDIKDIDVDAQTYTSDSMAFQQMANIGSQKTDPTTPTGMMAEGLAASISTFFDGTKTFKERLDKISAFSTAVFDTKKIENMSVTEMLAASLFGDYLNTIVKEIDSGSGAYQFEVLLAQMAGGSVTGKGDVDASGNVTSGQMGAVDFVMNDGTYGSAKYYANLGASTVTQSVSGFNNKVGKPILYVVAHKVGTPGAAVTKRGTSDPTEIQEIHIYLVSITPIVEEPKIDEHFLVHTNGTDPHYAKVKGGKILIMSELSSAEAITVKISPNNEKFKDALKIAADASDQKIKAAFSEFQSLFSNLNKANQKMQRYSSTGDEKIGNEALEGFDEADKGMVSLIELISSGKKVVDTGTKREIQESKITANFLKKLIQESFKK